jgi:GT2 family glycosyltransferase
MRSYFPKTFLDSKKYVMKEEIPKVFPAIDIIVCVHNAPECTRKCLQSLNDINLRNWNLILVDDGSSIETKAVLNNALVDFPIRKHLVNSKPMGYTKALNLALTESEAKFVLTLNSDTVLTSGTLSRMLQALLAFPETGVVGPLSNAAGWQSIPENRKGYRNWSVNKVPGECLPGEYEKLLARHSLEFFPEVAFLNGFCMLIRAEVFESIGIFDEEHFSRGYGEEDDFILRARNAGWSIRVADNCYVWHEKSQSFGHARRKLESSKSQKVLRGIYGSDKIVKDFTAMNLNEELRITRTWAANNILTFRTLPEERLSYSDSPLTLCWFQPHMGAVGGIRRTIEMTNFFASKNFADCSVATPKGDSPGWLSMRASPLTYAEAQKRKFDIVITSDSDTSDEAVKTKCKLLVCFYLGAYHLYRTRIKGFESFFGSALNSLYLANSKWTEDRLGEYRPEITVDAIIPGGVNLRMFYPCKVKKEYDVGCSGSKRAWKGTSDIEKASEGFSLLKLGSSPLHQKHLAKAISSCRVFVSACWHEGFNNMALEAMACGVPVVITSDGGSAMYVENEVNALVVPVKDPEALQTAICRLLRDKYLRLRIIEGGLKTASEFTWENAARKFIHAINERFQAVPENSTETASRWDLRI